MHGIYTKSDHRLYYIIMLRTLGVSKKNNIPSVLEYVCQVWHPGLSQQEGTLIESTQNRASCIINSDLHYAIWRTGEIAFALNSLLEYKIQSTNYIIYLPQQVIMLLTSENIYLCGQPIDYYKRSMVYHILIVAIICVCYSVYLT